MGSIRVVPTVLYVLCSPYAFQNMGIRESERNYFRSPSIRGISAGGGENNKEGFLVHKMNTRCIGFPFFRIKSLTELFLKQLSMVNH